jgi:TfoX/Sxy family transcriptional regulator of competence genes
MTAALDDALAAYDRALATVPGAERRGAKLPYTSVNGNMSSFVDTGTLALRLSRADRDRFIAEFGTSLHVSQGHVMKEYVTVPAALLSDTPRLAFWFAASWDYVSGLKPKPTTRRKKGS